MARREQKFAAPKDEMSESRHMIAANHLLRQPRGEDKEMQLLSTRIAADQKSLKECLEERARQTERQERNRHSEIIATIFDALNAPSSKEAAIAGTKIAKNSTHVSTSDILAYSNGLVRHYEKMNSKIAELQSGQAEAIADTWKQEIGQTEQQLRMGARVALRNAKKVMGAGTDSMEEDGDVEMQSGKGKDLNYDLQTSLKYAERGIRRMAKAIPHATA